MIAFPRSVNLSKDEYARLQLETQEAQMNQTRWQLRGPREEAGVGFWRGQPRREGKFGGAKRFAKRGGQRKFEFQEAARRGELMPSRNGAVRVNTGEAWAAMRSGHDGFNSRSPANRI